MEFLTLLKQTGIFLLVGQIVLQLRPGRQYEKYVRMLLGLMVLTQLAVPVLSLGNPDKIQAFLDTMAHYSEWMEEAGELGLLSEVGIDQENGEKGWGTAAEREVDISMAGLELEVQNRLFSSLSEQGLRLARLQAEDGKLLLWVEASEAVIHIDPVDSVQIRTAEEAEGEKDRTEPGAEEKDRTEPGAEERDRAETGVKGKDTEKTEDREGIRDGALEETFSVLLGMQAQDLEVRRLD